MERLGCQVVGEDAEDEPDQTGNDEIHKLKLAGEFTAARELPTRAPRIQLMLMS